MYVLRDIKCCIDSILKSIQRFLFVNMEVGGEVKLELARFVERKNKNIESNTILPSDKENSDGQCLH